MIVIASDYTFGVLGTYLLNHANSGHTEKIKYICDRTNEDILIMGSSRAVHHYDPLIIEDSLHISCYNCGYDGCGSITAYGLLRMLTEHYSPRIILYEVTPDFDYLKTGNENTRFLRPLKMFYDRNGIDSIFIKCDKNEGYKMNSKMYRMNSQLIELLSENIVRRNQTIKGYIPQKRVMKYEPSDNVTKKSIEYDTLKIEYLNRIVDLCKSKQIKLVFIISPNYQKSNMSKYKYVEILAKKNELPVLNHSCDTLFVGKRAFFYDAFHMNEEGASAYTRHITSELRELH